MHVVNVVKNGNRIAYYECIDNNGNQYKLKKDQLIKEIESGNCDNAKLQIYYGSKIVRISNKKNASVTTANNSDRQIVNQITHNSNQQNYYNYNMSLGSANRPKSLLVGKQANARLLQMEIGTPLKIKESIYSDFQQVIFMGIKNVQTREAFVFFNNEGLTGSFALSSKFIENNTETVQFMFDNNDPVEVTKLINILKSRHAKL